jgi:hypothetical protein
MRFCDNLFASILAMQLLWVAGLPLVDAFDEGLMGSHPRGSVRISIRLHCHQHLYQPCLRVGHASDRVDQYLCSVENGNREAIGAT